MRSMGEGLFWQDEPGRILRPMPPIPETGWRPPTHFPDLSRAKVISVDVETYDPEINECGPGWARGVGHIVGIAIGADGGGRWYFPIRHEIEPEHNLDPVTVLRWVKDVLSDPNQPKVGANIVYDIGWLKQEGIEVAGTLYDVQWAEALLDESAKVALDKLGVKYLNEGKTSEILYEWCSAFYGGEVNGGQRANIYRSPPRLVGPYAESDADLPLRVIEKQWPLLHREGLLDLFFMECDMINLYVAMRFEGVSVDLNYAEKLRDDLLIKEQEAQQLLDKRVGFGVNVNAGDSLAKAFDAEGVSYGRTETGKPSFRKEFLEGLEHPLGKAVVEVRKLQKLRGTFVENYILNKHVNGKLYCQFHPLRGDGGGTRSGRYSSSDPNLQNIPSRDPELAPMVRGLFIPDEGHPYWRKYDYSQIEYRFLVHFAVGRAGDEARAMFNANPDLDYHDFAQQLVKDKTGMFIERKPIKNINFGLIYGMGIKKLGDGLGLSRKEAENLFSAYFNAVPFAKDTMDQCTAEAERTGVITTILNRKSRFDLWGPARHDSDAVALPYDRAIREYGDIKRAFVHKALNRKLQGSAADQIKKAMWSCWKDGVFDETGVPRLTVHDELNFSDPGDKVEAFKEMKHRMETAVPLRIPVKADGEIGKDWGHVEDIVD